MSNLKNNTVEENLLENVSGGDNGYYFNIYQINEDDTICDLELSYRAYLALKHTGFIYKLPEAKDGNVCYIKYGCLKGIIDYLRANDFKSQIFKVKKSKNINELTMERLKKNLEIPIFIEHFQGV